MKGFALTAFASGRKIFTIDVYPHGRRKRSTIGALGPFTPASARSEAEARVALVARGGDPDRDRQSARAVPTLDEIVDDFVASKPRKAKTASEYRRILRTQVCPRLGKKRLPDITGADFERLHSVKAKTSPPAADVMARVFSALWGWAARKRKIVRQEDNPTNDLDRHRPRKRERFLSGAEFARLGDALREAETIGLAYSVDDAKPTAKHAAKPDNRRTKIDPFAVGAIRLLLLTGCRLREILHLRWEHVDFERGLLTLPDSKTGAKNVILGAAALQALAALPRIANNPLVIPGRNGPRSDLQKPWAAARRAARLSDVRIHDLRHSFASVGASGGLNLPTIARLLGHSQVSTTERYSHLSDDPTRRAADSISATIAGQLAGTQGARVMSIASRGK